MNIIKNITIRTVLMALLALPCVLSAKELACKQAPINEGNETSHFIAGDRSYSVSEYIQKQELRYQEIQDKQAEGYETPIEAEEAAEKEEGLCASLISDDENTLSAKGVFNSSHPGAFHNPRIVSAFGDYVWLEDGSKWEVRQKDRQKALDWFTGDLISITPNHDWFSSYRFRLNNRETGACIRVNLKEVAFSSEFYFPHQIMKIDWDKRELCLEDGSIWYVTWWDRKELNHWQPSDYVIIGVNDTWWSRKKNILINVNRLDYVWTNCIYP